MAADATAAATAASVVGPVRLTEGGVGRLYETLEKSRTDDGAADIVFELGVVVQVLSIDRFMVDSSVSAATKLDYAPSYCYDATISDGVFLGKCHLDPSIYSHIQKGAFIKNCIVQVDAASIRYNSLSLDSQRFLIVHQLRVVGYSNDAIITSEDGALEFPDYASEKERDYRPLPEDIYADITDDELFAYAVDENQLTIAEILSAYSRGSNGPFPPLVGRVTRKSRLVHYGKPTDVKGHAYPYKFSFDIEDRSGSVSVVVWNSSCADYFALVTVGSAVEVDTYRLQMYAQKLEVSVNSRNPASHITPLLDIHVLMFPLPPVEYKFLSHAQLAHTPDDTLVDFCGVVVYAGRVQKISTSETFPEFALLRWVVLMDSSSEHPISVKLFCSSQPNAFITIAPETVLALTNVSVASNTYDSKRRREVYLKSTQHTQILVNFTEDSLVGAEEIPTVVQELLEFAPTVEEVRENALVNPDALTPALRSFSLVPDGFIAWYPRASSVDDHRELYHYHRFISLEEIAAVAEAQVALETTTVLVLAKVAKVELCGGNGGNGGVLALESDSKDSKKRGKRKRGGAKAGAKAKGGAKAAAGRSSKRTRRGGARSSGAAAENTGEDGAGSDESDGEGGTGGGGGGAGGPGAAGVEETSTGAVQSVLVEPFTEQGLRALPTVSAVVGGETAAFWRLTLVDLNHSTAVEAYIFPPNLAAAASAEAMYTTLYSMWGVEPYSDAYNLTTVAEGLTGLQSAFALDISRAGPLVPGLGRGTEVSAWAAYVLA